MQVSFLIDVVVEHIPGDILWSGSKDNQEFPAIECYRWKFPLCRVTRVIGKIVALEIDTGFGRVQQFDPV